MTFWQSRYHPQITLSQQDLLDISEEITQSYAPHDTHHKPELVLMPVDPKNLYAYWNLKQNMAYEICHVDKQLALRIYSLPKLSEQPDNFQLCFDVNVLGFQNQQKVHLPVAATAYSAVIGEINLDDSFTPLATANIIHVPRENRTPEKTINDDNKNTIQLSETDGNNITIENSTPDSKATKNRLNENQNNVQIGQALENNIVTGHAPLEIQLTENNRNNIEKTRQTTQAIENDFVTMLNKDNANREAFILKNFKGYGYDLKIYANDPDSELTSILSMHEKNNLLSNKNTTTTDKNNSGQGCL